MYVNIYIMYTLLTDYTNMNLHSTQTTVHVHNMAQFPNSAPLTITSVQGLYGLPWVGWQEEIIGEEHIAKYGIKEDKNNGQHSCQDDGLEVAGPTVDHITQRVIANYDVKQLEMDKGEKWKKYKEEGGREGRRQGKGEISGIVDNTPETQEAEDAVHLG